jgi:hypothetical protein
MTNERHNLIGTEESCGWKISLTKLDKMWMEQKKRNLMGWAAQAPEEGQPYIVLLDKSTGLKTSPVQEVQEVKNDCIIRTLNSVYRIEHIKRALIIRRRRVRIDSNMGK